MAKRLKIPKPGDHVRFYDNALVVHGKPSMSEGVCNGKPLKGDDGETFVPVWTERDKGREPTTIYVNARNVLEVE